MQSSETPWYFLRIKTEAYLLALALPRSYVTLRAKDFQKQKSDTVLFMYKVIMVFVSILDLYVIFCTVNVNKLHVYENV